MKDIDNLDMSSVNRMFNGLKPVTIAPDFESGKMLPNISHEMYAILLLEEEEEIKKKCREAAITLDSKTINVYLFDLAEQKREIETLWTEGARFTYEREGEDIQLNFHPLEGKKFIDVKVKHIDRLIEYLKSLIDINKTNIQTTKQDDFGYCITQSKIVGLYELFNNKIIEDMDCADFMRCFALNSQPAKRPIYIHQNTMAYTLGEIKKQNCKLAINQNIALTNFGIKNFDSVKSQIKNKYPIEPLLKLKIDNILN